MLLQIQEQTVVAHCLLILLQVVVDFFVLIWSLSVLSSEEDIKITLKTK